MCTWNECKEKIRCLLVLLESVTYPCRHKPMYTWNECKEKIRCLLVLLESVTSLQAQTHVYVYQLKQEKQ